MLSRSFIKQYDQTTSGATVIEAFQNARYHGVAITYVGAQIYCPACKSTGRIVASGPRHPGLWLGKQVALESDLCMCDCKPLPRLIASQWTAYQTLNAEALAAQGYTSSGVPLLSHYDEQITLRDSRTRRALANVRYRIKDGTGVLASGITDSNGRTGRFVTDAAWNMVIEIAH